MLNTQETAAAAMTLAHGYDFNQALADYNWPDGTPLSTAWAERVALEGPPFNLDYAQEVHKWGFGGAEIPRAVLDNPNFMDALTAFLEAWSAAPQVAFLYPPSPNCNRARTLINLLDIPGLGIARVSKWACFIDQSRYAIYDSRVAYVLRDLLTQPQCQRLFPFVPARPAPAGQAQRVSQDSLISKPRCATTTFVNFLLVVEETANVLNRVHPLNAANQVVVGPSWTPALVEMALFQLGAARTKYPGIAKVCSQVNHPWP